MARKSRKTNVAAPAETSCVTKTYRTAIYVRLSYEGERKIEQESVENQVAFLKAFVDGAADLTLLDKYIDRGVSGANFDRPDFNRMMNDMKAGKLDCIVVKDLSRLGRNYLEAVDYIDKIFPFFGVRFIAVTDNYDSLTSEPTEDGLIIPLKNLINEAYAKDISRKIRSSIDNMYRDGIMVVSSIAYGYLKDPDGDHQIMIDEVAAPVVRRIFDEYIGGKGVSSIAKGLNEDGISSPSVRQFETGARKKRYSGNEKDASDLCNCYWNSLELAAKNDVHSIAFPAISTGVYRYPLEDATLIAIRTVREWMDQNNDYSIRVIFTCFDEKTYSCYRENL